MVCQNFGHLCKNLSNTNRVFTCTSMYTVTTSKPPLWHLPNTNIPHRQHDKLSDPVTVCARKRFIMISRAAHTASSKQKVIYAYGYSSYGQVGGSGIASGYNTHQLNQWTIHKLQCVSVRSASPFANTCQCLTYSEASQPTRNAGTLALNNDGREREGHGIQWTQVWKLMICVKLILNGSAVGFSAMTSCTL